MKHQMYVVMGLVVWVCMVGTAWGAQGGLPVSPQAVNYCQVRAHSQAVRWWQDQRAAKQKSTAKKSFFHAIAKNLAVGAGGVALAILVPGSVVAEAVYFAVVPGAVDFLTHHHRKAQGEDLLAVTDQWPPTRFRDIVVSSNK